MIKSKDTIGVITGRRKSGSNMILTIKNPYTGTAKKIPVIESIYKTIILLKVIIKITFLLTKKFKISSKLSLKAENLL